MDTVVNPDVGTPSKETTLSMVSSDLSTVFEENMRFKDKDLLLERTTATETLLLDSRRSAGVFVLQCQSIGLGGTIPLETGGFKQLD